MTDQPDPYAGRRRFTTKQAADYAERHPNTIRDALNAEELHGAQRVKGGKWSIRRECLDAWIDGDKCPHQRAGAVVALDRAS